MFKNEEDFKRTVNRLNIDDKPNPVHRERLREQMLSVFDKTGEQTISQSRPLWRTIMKSPIGKLAAAAVIIIVVLIGIHQLGNSVNVTTVAMAQVREAMEKVNWLRCTGTGHVDVMEQWYSFASKIEVCKEQSGKVTYYDYGEKKKYFYEPENNTITVSDIPGDGFALGTASPTALLEKIIQSRQNEGTEVIYKAGQYNDTKVEIWELRRSEENRVENIKIFINMKNHLPIAAEVKYTDLNGKNGYEGKVEYEYPKNGPMDIYALDVPQTAKVIDKTDVYVAKGIDEPKLIATPKPTIGPEMAALDIKLPRAMFVGTPEDIKLARLEKPLGKPRPPFYAPVGTKNVAFGKPVTSTDEMPIIGEIEMITDGDKEGADGSYVEMGPLKQHVTIDLGAEHDIYAIVVWHFHKQPRVYFDVVAQVASDPDFTSNITTVFNNDIDNSLGFGVGKDMHYVDTNEGRLIDAKGVRARYVRFHSNGNSTNDLNHYIEVEVYGKAAADKPVSTPDEKKDQQKSDNGDTENADPNTAKSEMAPLAIKLPRPMFVGTPQDIKVANLEKPLGKPRPPFYAPVGTKNAALGKKVTSTDEMPIIGEIEMITDGDKEGSDGSYVELGPFKQHITIDLGTEHDIYAIVVWHFHKQPRVYFDVVVQVASKPNFVKPKTLFNNDIDNSLKFGVGKNMHYVETSEGKLIDAKGTRGRYVRLYSQGNTHDDLNHYIEVEVYGKAVK